MGNKLNGTKPLNDIEETGGDVSVIVFPLKNTM